jgi:hypothetical protein
MSDKQKLARAKHVLHVMSGVTDEAIGNHDYAHSLRRWARELLVELFPKSKEANEVMGWIKREND